MRHAARVDATQAEIVKALRAIGCEVVVIGLPVDLMVWHRNAIHLVECKTPEGRLTKYQVEFVEKWPGPVHIVRSPSEAVGAVVGQEAMK